MVLMFFFARVVNLQVSQIQTICGVPWQHIMTSFQGMQRKTDLSYQFLTLTHLASVIILFSTLSYLNFYLLFSTFLKVTAQSFAISLIIPNEISLLWILTSFTRELRRDHIMERVRTIPPIAAQCWWNS